MKMGRSNLEVFADTLLELGGSNKDLLVVTGDSRGSGKLGPFGQKLPKQIVEIGIAEQNLVGVSAGLASTGKIVFTVSPASFLTARSLEQIKNDVAYSDIPVKLIGISAGVSYGALGSTHHSLHDFAVLRAIYNITIMAPADNFETEQAILSAYEMDHPVYIRFGKQPMAHLHTETSDFRTGKAFRLAKGEDVLFIAAGETVFHALEAAKTLNESGWTSTVLSVFTIKPLDAETILAEARGNKVVITVEEHSVNGGLGEAVAGLLMQNNVSTPFRIVGIPDEYTVTGSQMEIFEHYGISDFGLARTAVELLT